jgi:JmjC domain, hydroxylase
MEGLPAYLHRVARPLADLHGAVRVDPPADWTRPALRLAGGSRFFVRVQRLPALPAPDAVGGDRRFGANLVFPDSKAPVSLDAYRRRATRFHAYMMRSLFEEKRAAAPTSRGVARKQRTAQVSLQIDARTPASVHVPARTQAPSDNSVATNVGQGTAGASGSSDPEIDDDVGNDNGGDDDDDEFLGAQALPKGNFVVAPEDDTAYMRNVGSNECALNAGTVSGADEDSSRCEEDDDNVSVDDSELQVSTEEYEEAFWRALSCGVDGQPIDVPYGVDVEAEGAFDNQGMSYVEWNASPASDRLKAAAVSAIGTQQSVRDAALDAYTAVEPTWHVGNINSAGVLRHLPRMPGINHSMFYIGQMFTRFCWHVEDAHLNSISYLHNGSAEKIWYIIPPSSSNVFEAYASQEVFAPHMQRNGESGHTLLMAKTILFDPRDVSRRGIPVSRIVHTPGSFVYTAPGAYHGGFNCGFNISEAVNFGMPNWLAQGRHASLFAQAVPRSMCIPHEFIVFREAVSFVNSLVIEPVEATALATGGEEQALEQYQHVQRVIDGKFLATELRRIIDIGERAIEEFVTATSCLIVEGVPQFDTGDCVDEGADSYSHCREIGLAFGNGAGMQCSTCLHASHFYSAVCGTCSDGGEQARCPQHFSVGGPLCSHPGHRPMIIRRHEPVLLLDLLAECERVAGTKVPADELVRRYTGYVRHWTTSASLPPRAVPSSGLRLRLVLPDSFHEERAAVPSSKRLRRSQPSGRKIAPLSCPLLSDNDDDDDVDYRVSGGELDLRRDKKKRRKNAKSSIGKGVRKKHKTQPLVEA